MAGFSAEPIETGGNGSYMRLRKTPIIPGAWPADLTAALEFCRESSIQAIVLKDNERVGGISCALRPNVNCNEISGHRFLSKSDRVTDWWIESIPVDGSDRSTGARNNPGEEYAA